MLSTFLFQMKKIEDKKKRERMEELEMIQIRQEADLIFQKNEEEKMRRRREEAQKLSNFHEEQAVSGHLWSREVETLSVPIIRCHLF